MDGAEISLIQESFTRLMTGKKVIANYFYSRLKDADSEVFDIMKKDAVNQGEVLISTITKVVNSLDDLTRIETDLQELAAKLKGKGFEDDSYNIIGAAWVDTLAYGFGNGFSWEIQNAWVKAYKAATTYMKA